MTNDEAIHRFITKDIKNMFNSTFFDICMINKFMGRIDRFNQDYIFLDRFHCVQWIDIPDEVATHIKKTTLKLLNLTEKDLEE